MNTSENTVRIWDPVVRIGHWTLVLAFFTAYFTEDDFLTQHVWAGYVVGSVVLLRIIWGFVGSRHARFSDFVRSPSTVLRYMRDLTHKRSPRYLGHNPAGGAMIMFLLISLSATVCSGLVLYAIDENAGPLAGWVANSNEASPMPELLSHANANEHDVGANKENDAREEYWEELHELFANLTLLLVAFHVLGVLYSSRVHRENLVKAMITGRKRASGGQAHREI